MSSSRAWGEMPRGRWSREEKGSCCCCCCCCWGWWLCVSCGPCSSRRSAPSGCWWWCCCCSASSSEAALRHRWTCMCWAKGPPVSRRFRAVEYSSCMNSWGTIGAGVACVVRGKTKGLTCLVQAQMCCAC
eukprot:1161080-Pelagomonas_calceolata.AAC.16